MKKRILSIVLCLVMVMGLLPMQAHAGEGSECAQCSHYHYGDYVCSGCGLCSSECSNSDCWYETHCKNCGACYMSADDWCDECGWCDDCMQEAHCLDCKRCFVGESKDELCEDCQRCTDCVEDNFVCEECRKCVDCGDDYDHCQSCHKHLEGGEVCGYCDDCAKNEGLHCEECGGCFETEVDHCPIHEDDAHCEGCAGDYCEECGECQFTNSDLALCGDCGLCKDCCREVSEAEGCSTGEVCVESSDWLNHFCSDCGECFCDKDKCSKCDRCTDCCKTAGECEGCDCGEATSEHTHRYDANKWVMDRTHHWNECRVCHAVLNSALHEDRDRNGKCDTCQCDPTKMLYIKKQPKDIVKKVSDEDLPDDDPYAPENNRAKFSVVANDLAGRPLTYQWYSVATDRATGQKYGPDKLENNEADYINGATTSTLDIGVPIDGCKYTYEFYCEVTATAEDGASTTITSRYARLRTTHNYSKLTCSDKPQTVWINYHDGDGPSGDVKFQQGSVYHNQTCIGHKCGRTKLPKDIKHNFKFERYLGKGGYKDSPTVDKYFYLMKCTDCGYEDLKVTTSETNLPWAITLDAPEGSYAVYEATDQITTSALPGTNLYAVAPYVNDDGYVFEKWEIADASVDFTLTNDPVNIGICTFTMPTHDIILRAVYDDTKVPVETISITKKDNVPITGRSITVKVGDTFTVDSTLTPSKNIMDNRVQWCVLGYTYASPEIVFDASCASDPASASDTLSKPMTGPVTLKAEKVGTVHLRATAYASILGGEHVSDYVRVNVVAADAHITHDYKVTTTLPTCTQKGYTLYECKDSACGHVYKTDIIDSTGHKDDNGDGLCDNINQNTGKPCGIKISVTGRAKIDLVDLLVTEPAKGAKPAAITSEDERYTVANTQWMTPDGTALDPNDTFAPGTVYTVMVTLEAEDGYAFQLKAFSKTMSLRPTAVVKATQFQINSNEVKPGNGSSRETVNLIYTFPATATSHSGSGSSTGSTAYTVTVLDSKNGAVTADRKSASAGSTVKLTVSPDKGYTLETLTVLDKNGKQIKCTEKNGRYTFTMPASNVTVKATFLDDNTMLNFFVDVKAGDYYYDAVLWAAENGITGGTDATHFTPSGICTRAQAVTFLWRAAGSPAPKSADMPFTDVPRGSYYETAVLWAVENGITRGTSDTTFSPEETCTRAQIVTFLWRSRKSPAAGSVNPFTDVKSDAYYTDAVLWAVKESVTSGTTAATFSPDENCTRAQIVTFIYRALAK